MQGCSIFLPQHYCFTTQLQHVRHSLNTLFLDAPAQKNNPTHIYGHEACFHEAFKLSDSVIEIMIEL